MDEITLIPIIMLVGIILLVLLALCAGDIEIDYTEIDELKNDYDNIRKMEDN